MASKYRKTFTFEGIRYQVYGSTLEEAIEKMVLKKQALKEGKVYRESSVTVKEWATEAVELYKSHQADITRERYMSVMDANIFCEIGDLPLKAVTKKDCQMIINNINGNSTDHIRKVHNMLKFIFGKAVEHELIVKSPATSLAIPKGTKKKSRTVTAEEERAVEKLCQNDEYYIFLLMLRCGCRPSEARNVKSSDIEGGLLHIRGRKTASADRYVPIPREVSSRAKTALKNENSASYSNLCRSFRKDMRNILGDDYREDFRPYYLRHTYCTDLKEKGVDIRDAQYLMGHANISMTSDIYTHADRNTALKVAYLIGQK